MAFGEKPKTPVKLVGQSIATPSGVRAQQYLEVCTGDFWVCSTSDEFHFIWDRLEYATKAELDAVLRKRCTPRLS